MSVIQLAMIFFIVTNPIGNSPTIIALIKDYPLRKQQKILFRESIFAMILAIFFLFLGETFLGSLRIQNYALTFSGGILLFIVAIKMIFSVRTEEDAVKPKQDPYIVPIATPLLSGAGLMTMIMLYSKQEGNDLKILSAILLAWVGVTGVLVMAPYLQIFLGKRGLAALEQLMGMLLAMIAMEMLVKGTTLFITALQSV
ncbi:MAG: MarC family protein [Parachlamydiaceae bacterium]|nr:MarC family protein [Parachlamydiaceae bacterium]